MKDPGKICAVASCKSNNSMNKNVMYHRFPRDKGIQELWVKNTNRPDIFNPSTSRICSRHFLPENYQRDLKAELLGLPPKRLLKSDAIPTLCLTEEIQPELITEETQPELITQECLQNKNNQENKWLIEWLMDKSGNVPPEDCDADVANVPALLEEIKTLKNEKETLLKEISCLKNKLQMAESIINKIFSENEVKVLLNPNKTVHWTSDELSNAFTLRYISKKAYVYLRNTRGFPLPGISTLKRWAGCINLKNGILYDVLKIMKMAAQSLPSVDKLCVLSFDEIKIKETLEYDEHEDTIIGPHHYMQVAMVRSLTGKWKQPVFVMFDTKMTKEVLFSIINEVYYCGFKVVSTVSDCGGSNVGLWEALGITPETPYFSHPHIEHPIVYMPDVPHLLKLVRNWLIDKGFVLSDNRIVNKKPIEELLKITMEEITVCPKLKDIHLTCIKSQRQNVALAAQLLSNTVGTALIRYKPGEDKELAENTGQFIKIINSWFDLCNVRIASKTIPQKSGFGLFLEEQVEMLEDVEKLIKEMRCIGKTSLQTFQKGIIMVCNGLPILLNNVQSEGVKYILTSRLNQDCLESLFGQVREKGGLYDHPSPLNAIHRLRAILLGKNPGMVSKNPNVTFDEEDEDNFIFTNVLKKAQVEPKITPPKHTEQLETVISSSSSETSSDEGTFQELKETSKDGLQYIAGWLAYKFRKKFPKLAEVDKNPRDHTYSLPSWIKHLSLGGLPTPKNEFFEKVKLMEKYFIKLSQGTEFKKKKTLF